jgi:hypothetical protein
MRKAKRADFLRVWDALLASQKGYAIGSLVSRRDGGDSGKPLYAYRKVYDGLEVTTPPEVAGSGWSRDFNFASPWDQKIKYKIGDIVYFDNGQKSYLYKASLRYFGGNGQPNREEDLDGVRTWELFIDYKFTRDRQMPDLLIPFLKKVGDNGYERRPFSIYSTEEDSFSSGYSFANALLTYESNPLFTPLEDSIKAPKGSTTGDSTQGVAYHGITKSGTPEDAKNKKPYRGINSVYQSFAYDDSTYSFEKLTNVEEQKYTHRKIGLHKAMAFKEGIIDSANSSDEQKEQASLAKSQYYYVSIDSYYFRKHGFSIDIWPNISNEDFSFVPTTGLRDIGDTQNSHLRKYYIPSYQVQLTTRVGYIEDGGPYTGYGSNGGYGNVDEPYFITTPIIDNLGNITGYNQQSAVRGFASEQELLEKSMSYWGTAFARNSPFFDNLSFTIISEVYTAKLEWEVVTWEEEYTHLDSNGNWELGIPPVYSQRKRYYQTYQRLPLKPTFSYIYRNSNVRPSRFKDSRYLPFKTIHGVDTIQSGGVKNYYNIIQKQSISYFYPIGWKVS